MCSEQCSQQQSCIKGTQRNSDYRKQTLTDKMRSKRTVYFFRARKNFLIIFIKIRKMLNSSSKNNLGYEYTTFPGNIIEQWFLNLFRMMKHLIQTIFKHIFKLYNIIIKNKECLKKCNNLKWNAFYEYLNLLTLTFIFNIWLCVGYCTLISSSIFISLSRFFVLIFVNVENPSPYNYGVENCSTTLIAFLEIVLNPV